MGFFDGITKKGAEISNSLQESINKSQRISALKKNISENNSKVSNNISAIGEEVYNKRTMDEELMTFISGKIDEIDNLKKENEVLNKELLGLNNKKKCLGCGAEVDIDITFCPSCGKEQEKVEIEPFIPNGKRKCASCGEIIDDSNVFCPKCGAKKEENVEEVEEVEIVEDIPVGKRKCSGCSEIISEADVFCANCGAKKEEAEEK